MPAPVDHDQKRQEVARIAADLIARRGIEAATIRQVAAQAGFSSAVVTHYFANKSALLLAAYRLMAQDTQARFDAATRDAADPLARLEILLPLDEEGRRAWRVYLQFWPIADHDEQLAEEQRWWTANARGLARATLMAAYPDLEDIEDKAALALSGIQGIALQALFDPEHWPASRQIAMWRAYAAMLNRSIPRT